MEIYGLSLLGIAVATFIGMALGALWYSPLLFGKQWMHCINKTSETLGKPIWPMIGSVVASLLTAVGLSVVFLLVGVESLAMGIHIGLVLGFFIIFPALLSDNLFCGWGKQLLFIQAGYRIISVILMSLALVYLA